MKRILIILVVIIFVSLLAKKELQVINIDDNPIAELEFEADGHGGYIYGNKAVVYADTVVIKNPNAVIILDIDAVTTKFKLKSK